MIWPRMLAYITGTVDQELLLRNEYLAAENRILRAQIKGRLLLSDAEKATLAEIAHRLRRKALEELAAVAKPDTLLAWYRKLIANMYLANWYGVKVQRNVTLCYTEAKQQFANHRRKSSRSCVGNRRPNARSASVVAFSAPRPRGLWI